MHIENPWAGSIMGSRLGSSVDIRLPIPGLEGYVPAIEAGCVVLVEGGPEPDKEFFLEIIAQSIAAAGGTVTWFTTRDVERPHRTQVGNEVRAADSEWQEVIPSTPTIMDSFSLLCMGMAADEVTDGVRRMRGHVRSLGSLLVLCVEDGMLDPPLLSTVRHLADAIVQFRQREDGDTVQTFLRIPRWGPRHRVTQPIHYQFTGDRIALDTRRRHV